MKRMIYQVAVGRKSKLYEHCIESCSVYCEAHGIDHIVQRIPILKIKPDVFATNRSKESYEKHGGFLPIYEKENAFSYWDQYDQIAIIDADIWIRPGARNIFEEIQPDVCFAGVIEKQMPINEKYRQKIHNYSRMQYGPIKLDWNWDNAGGDFFNMGMMVMNKSITKYLKGQTPEQFIRRPEFKQFVDGLGPWKWSTDQTLLNVWLKSEKIPVQHLHSEWNSLFGALRDDRYYRAAQFVHFFLKDHLPNQGENVEELMKHVNN